VQGLIRRGVLYSREGKKSDTPEREESEGSRENIQYLGKAQIKERATQNKRKKKKMNRC